MCVVCAHMPCVSRPGHILFCTVQEICMSLQFSLGTSCTGWDGDLKDDIVVEDETILLVDTIVLVIVEVLVVAAEMAAAAIMFVVVLDLKTSEGLWFGKVTWGFTCAIFCKKSLIEIHT